MIEKLVLPEIRELIEANDLATLGGVLNDWLPADVASLLQSLDPTDVARVLQALDPSLASQVFEYLDLDTQERMLGIMSEAQSAAILEGMSPDDRTALLEELPQELADRLLALLSPEQQAIADSLLQYNPESVGRLMTPDYIAVKKDWTIKHVLDHVRTHGKDSETLNVIYVVDDENKLIDDLRIRFVLLAPLHQHVRDLIDDRFIALKATDDKKTAVERLSKVRPHRPAGDRRARHARRNRHDRRRAGRGRGGGDPRDPEVRRP